MTICGNTLTVAGGLATLISHFLLVYTTIAAVTAICSSCGGMLAAALNNVAIGPFKGQPCTSTLGTHFAVCTNMHHLIARVCEARVCRAHLTCLGVAFEFLARCHCAHLHACTCLINVIHVVHAACGQA